MGFSQIILVILLLVVGIILTRKKSSSSTNDVSKEGLSHKYRILRLFGNILIIIAILTIISCIIAIVNILDTRGQEAFIILPIIFTFISLAGIYCSLALINFVFELDKTKSDKV